MQRPVAYPHQHDQARAPRYRFAGDHGHLAGCPLRQDYDALGRLRNVACVDIKGTFGSCFDCDRRKMAEAARR